MRPASQLLLCLLLAAPLGAQGEIYRWRDASGREHFTQDLGQVPPRHRAEAAARARAGGGSAQGGTLQTFSGPSDPPAVRSPSPASAPEGPVHRVRVQRAGPSMMVHAKVNGSLMVPFLIDTGASDVLIPRSVADRLGIGSGPDTRTKHYATANGVVEHEVVMLSSVDLAGAVVRDVPASISPSMQIGLLGLSYFNHFTYNIDAAAGVVTLVPNGLAAEGRIRGGRSQAQWHSEFANLHRRMRSIDEEVERKPDSHGRELRRLAEARADLERQLALLEAEADRARVPASWRD